MSLKASLNGMMDWGNRKTKWSIAIFSSLFVGLPAQAWTEEKPYGIKPKAHLIQHPISQNDPPAGLRNSQASKKGTLFTTIAPQAASGFQNVCSHLPRCSMGLYVSLKRLEALNEPDLHVENPDGMLCCVHSEREHSGMSIVYPTRLAELFCLCIGNTPHPLLRQWFGFRILFQGMKVTQVETADPALPHLVRNTSKGCTVPARKHQHS